MNREIEHYPGVYSAAFTPAELVEIYRKYQDGDCERDFDDEQPRPLFRNWALRLNAWCERKLDTTDWMAFELKAERVCGVLLTGVGLYFLCVVADAAARHFFSLGAGR